MPWPDAMILWRELEDWPPVRMTFGAFAGYKKKRGLDEPWEDRPLNDDEFSALQIATGGAGAGAMPEELKDAIRWAEEFKQKRRKPN